MAQTDYSADPFFAGDQYSPNAPPDPNAPPADGVPKPKPTNAVTQWYQQYLGRAPESQSVADAWGAQGASAEQGIKDSPEARAYAAAHTAPAAPAAPAATPALTAPNFGGGGAWTPRPRNPLYDQFLNQLLERANDTDLNVDPNDPLIQRQTDAYAADQTRAGRQFLQGQAERAGPYGSIRAETRHAGEVVGQNTAGFRGQLMQREVDARRKDISDALNGAYGMLTADEQTRLREEDQSLANRRFGADTTQQAWEDQYRTLFG